MQARPSLAGPALALALAACAAVPPPPAGAQAATSPPPPQVARSAQRAETLTGDAGRDLVRGLLASLADRVVEVRRAWTGPGYYLHGFELWERATATHTNVCSVRVHRLNLTELTEDARHNPDAALNPGARAESVSSEVRYRAVGPVLANASSRAHEPACAALTSASGYFRAPSEPDAYSALQAFENLQYFAREPSGRMIGSIECTSFEQPCRDARGVLAGLSTQNLTIVRRVPCADGTQQCWQFNIQPPREASWTVTMRNLGRPARVVMEQVQPPVV
jgi:hypothetical protein